VKPFDQATGAAGIVAVPAVAEAGLIGVDSNQVA
jgi:hypothetical protein